MTEAYRPYYEDDDFMSGAAPIPGDPREMGRIIHEELQRREEHELLDYMNVCFREAEDVLPVGDLLDSVKAQYNAEKMVASLQLLYAMQRQGEAIMYEDNDRQRIVVERLRGPETAPKA